jgi:hypothetical protein
MGIYTAIFWVTTTNQITWCHSVNHIPHIQPAHKDKIFEVNDKETLVTNTVTSEIMNSGTTVMAIFYPQVPFMWCGEIRQNLFRMQATKQNDG